MVTRSALEEIEAKVSAAEALLDSLRTLEADPHVIKLAEEQVARLKTDQQHEHHNVAVTRQVS
jgi:hypothetical protein